MNDQSKKQVKMDIEDLVDKRISELQKEYKHLSEYDQDRQFLYYRGAIDALDRLLNEYLGIDNDAIEGEETDILPTTLH